MPKGQKGKKGGGKASGRPAGNKAIAVPEEGQDYGLVLKTLGDRHFTVQCQKDGVERLCHVRGKMKNRQFVRNGDIVLVCIRDFDDKTGDIVDIIPPEHARILRKDGELKIGTALDTTDLPPEDELGIDIDFI